VTGHQWWWEVQYPDARVVTANEVHIPTGQPVYITLRSGPSGTAGGPVIHSFWVPRLAGKQDVVPNQDNHLTIEATDPGTYVGQCAEFCGLSHADMRLRVVAQTPPDYQAWLQHQLEPAAPPPPDILQTMTDLGCGGCHTLGGVENFVGTIGPNLTHFADREAFAGDTFNRTDDNVRKWLQDAPGMKAGADMPSFEDQLSGPALDALVAYLQSLS
jgi:cytochrome c oxidase subunit II